MFVEPKFKYRKEKGHIGWIEVICGSMFSGKTEELIRRVNRAVIAQQEVLIFKPGIDVRYHSEKVVSHNANALTSIPVSNTADILDNISAADVIAIDEAQFFDASLVEVCVNLANKGFRVIVSGLDMDYEGQPFGPIPSLMSVAEYVTKLHAICMQCGDLALFSYRLVSSREKVLLGEKDSYEARCRRCFLEGMRAKEKEAASPTEEQPK